MQQPTFLFYDLETTGLNKAFDQVLRFAAIRTDQQYNELEREEISICLRPDIIPHPLAVATNQLSVDQCSQGVSEGEGITKIHKMLNQPGTISLGYNTLGFDDEFLRFSFFRNFLPPYTHQYASGCGRMDIYPMLAMYYLFDREALQWPVIEGELSFKLEELSKANKLASGASHDALVDVLATLELAKRLSKNQRMWSYLSDYFEKKSDQQRIQKLGTSFVLDITPLKLAFIVLPRLGGKIQYQSLVLYLGNSVPYPNQTLWLRLDLPELQDTLSETIQETTWVVRKKLGEPGFILPPLDRYWLQIDRDRKKLVFENLDWLQSQKEILREIIKYYQEFKYPSVPNLDLDASLYEVGFWNSKEKNWCRMFQASSKEEKIKLAQQAPSSTLAGLAKRYLFRNFPDQLSDILTQESQGYLKERLNFQISNPPMDYKNQAMLSKDEKLETFNELQQQKNLDPKKQELLKNWQTYISNQLDALN